MLAFLTVFLRASSAKQVLWSVEYEAIDDRTYKKQNKYEQYSQSFS